jgi:hypothetical protein
LKTTPITSAHAAQSRHWFLELMAYWEGRVTTGHISRQFGLSRQQASKIISLYKQALPDNLSYNAPRKGYVPTAAFKPRYINQDVNQYLRWLTSPHSLPCRAGDVSVPHEAVELPARQVEPELIRGLVSAMRQQYCVEVDYVSLTTPNREGRIIAPHTFINTGLRWHLRAWCEKNQQYRDFVLSRFRGAPQLERKSQHTAEQDTAWNTHITLIFEPDSRFDAARRDVIIRDYNMEDGQLRITTRAALAHYVIQEMLVNTRFLAEKPEEQQLVLVNKDDIKEWLFER